MTNAEVTERKCVNESDVVIKMLNIAQNHEISLKISQSRFFTPFQCGKYGDCFFEYLYNSVDAMQRDLVFALCLQMFCILLSHGVFVFIISFEFDKCR